MIASNMKEKLYNEERLYYVHLNAIILEIKMQTGSNTLWKPKRHSLRCHDFMVHA